jgi:hypothetical protein
MRAFVTAILLASTACGGGLGSPAPSLAKPEVETGPRLLSVGGATLEVDLSEPDPARADRLLRWVERSAAMVAEYCRGFPVARLRVELRTGSGAGVGYGQHFDGRLVRVRVGRDTSEDELARDWVLPHEMLHTALPDLRRRHRWMQEGLSTYLESVVRVRAGTVPERDVWARWVSSMRHGLPGPGHRGLDNTRTWGSVYWGGALFWLAVDVEIQERTEGRRSLRDALRGILDQGGNGRARWSTARVIEVADAATGTAATSELYDDLARRPGAVDLDRLFERLGVEGRGDEIELDDDAPLAYVRRNIMGAD